jgi:hypothetical protein
MKYPILAAVIFSLFFVSCEPAKKTVQPTIERPGGNVPSTDPFGLSDNTRFWSIDESGAVREWVFGSDSTVTGGKISAYAKADEGGCTGLAWCNVLDKTSKGALHVFMSASEQGFLGMVPLSAGSSVGIDKSKNLMNMGGWGNYLFIEYCSYKHEGTPNCIMRWRNKSFVRIVTLPESEEFGSADLAVDTLGRVWVLIGNWNYESTRALELRCYSPDGATLVSIPVRGISQMNAYGFMLVRGKFYVAFGDVNKQYPNRLVELVYDDGKMKPGNSFAFRTNGHDVASEDPGAPSFPGKK